MKAAAVFLCLLGMLCILWTVISWTNGTWNIPMDYLNLIGGIAVSACGVGLLAGKRTETSPLDSISLSSIGMAQSSGIAARMALPEKISGDMIGRSKSDFIPEIAVVKDVGGTTAQPVVTFRKMDERVESLIETASSLLTQEGPQT